MCRGKAAEVTALESAANPLPDLTTPRQAPQKELFRIVTHDRPALADRPKKPGDPANGLRAAASQFRLY